MEISGRGRGRSSGFFFGFLLFFVAARYADGDDGHTRIIDRFDLFGESKIANVQCLIEVEAGDVDLDRVWDVCGKTLDLEFVTDDREETAARGAECTACEFKGYGDLDGFVDVDADKVGMKGMAFDGMALHDFEHHHLIGLAFVFKLKLDDDVFALASEGLHQFAFVE